MNELQLTLHTDRARVVVGKKAKRTLNQRTTWTCQDLRLRLDTVTDEGGRVREDWALWLGSTLYGLGGAIKPDHMIEALREGFGLSLAQAQTLALVWLGETRQQAWEPRQAGTAWARDVMAKS